jgi:class 3 adenylate cyclase
LLHKYVALFAAVVCVTLLGNGLLEAWFLYREQTALLGRMQIEQADAAADKINQFVSGIEKQLGWTTQLPWSVGSMDDRLLDLSRLLRQAPAITEVAVVDATGRERLRVSRLELDVIDSRVDLSKDPKFVEATARKVHFGPVYFRDESEPYMTLALAGSRRDAGVSVAEINLKFIGDVVSQIKMGHTGKAFVVDAADRLIAHPDISMVLRNTDLGSSAQIRAARAVSASDRSARAFVTEDIQGQRVLSAFAPIVPLRWLVFVDLPLSEAYAPLYESLKLTSVVLLIGLLAALIAGILLARRMIVPIRALQEGAARIGSGYLDHRVEVHTGDELETLADQFNAMSVELLNSKQREERVGRLRRFLSPQLAEVIESSGSEKLLESHRREVSVVFCDMRGFTAFSEVTTPEQVMAILNEYHVALGVLIHKFEGTIERFAGDGVLVWFNDPLPCPNPSERAVRMAIEMRASVATLTTKWRTAGHQIGFGIGITYGDATLGRIGFEGRFDYSAIGSVVNLAARLCGEAKDGQILIDERVKAAVASFVKWESVGDVALKGIRQPVPAYNVIGLAIVDDISRDDRGQSAASTDERNFSASKPVERRRP